MKSQWPATVALFATALAASVCTPQASAQPFTATTRAAPAASRPATSTRPAATLPATAPRPAMRIAACDVAKLFAGYERVRDVEAKMTDRRKAILAEDERRAARIKEIEAELRDGLKPGTDAYQGRLSDLTRLTIDREVWQKTADADESRERRRLAEELYQDILAAVAKVAREHGCDMAVNYDQSPPDGKADIYSQVANRKILFCEPACDITEAVLARLNAEYRATKGAVAK